MQPYSVAHLRQSFTSPQTPNALTTGPVPLRFPEVRSNKPTSDIKGKRREADRTQLEAISEDLGTNEEREPEPTPLARSPHSTTSIPSANPFLGATTSTADIYRRPEPLLQYSYPYNYATPSASPSKSTLIPPKITLNSTPSSSTGQHHTTAGSTSKFFSSTFPTYPHSSPQESPTLSSQRRRSRDHLNNNTGTTQKAPIRRHKHGMAPLTSDARIEHVLLAARRIGRERAGVVAGIKQHAEREKELHSRELELIKARQDLEKSEKERLERLANGTSGLAYYRSTDIVTSPQQRNTGRGSATTAAPRTPKRGGGVGVAHYPALSGAVSNSPISTQTSVPASAGPSTFVFVNTSAIAGTSSATDQLGSVHKRGSTARGGSRNLPSNPPTPLDSLLDAARMMDDGAGTGEKAGGKMNGRRKASEHPESPVPKRRRVSSSSSKAVGRVGGGGLVETGTVTRVKSALDVLADQAAAAFDDEPGQTKRGSNTKGKEKERIDEGMSGGGDEGVDNAQGDLDHSWHRGSVGLNRGRSRAKTASNNTRPAAESTSASSMSLRPVRQASQKRLASRELHLPPSILTTKVRGKGKSRGRPKGNKSLPRSAASVKSSSTSKMDSPLDSRVVSTYSPLDEAIALLPQKDRKRESIGEHPHQLMTVDLDRSSSMGSRGLKPVMDWGDRSAEDEDDEGELGSDQNGYLEERNLNAAGKITTSSPEAQINTLSNDPTDYVSPTDVDLTTITVDTDAEADLDDEDAEGEQEEEEEDDDDDVEAGQGRSSRSRTPPPPDPPHPGAPSDSNNDDPDADADADGEMEFEESEELLPTSMSSAVYQTALSVSNMGQVPQGNFDASFFDDDGWLIVLWIKSDKFFGHNMTWTQCFHFGDVVVVVSGRTCIIIIAVNIVRPVGKDDSPLAYPKQEKSVVVSARILM